LLASDERKGTDFDGMDDDKEDADDDADTDTDEEAKEEKEDIMIFFV